MFINLIKLILLLGLLSLQMACLPKSPLQDTDLSMETPDKFEGGERIETSGDLPSQWWTEFGDPNIDRLVSTALENNPSIRQAASRLIQAQANAIMADASLLPQVDVGVNGRRQKQNFIGFPVGDGSGVLSTTSTSYGLSLNTSWEADLWGKLRAGSREALANLQASQADWEAVKLSISGQTVKAYLALAEAKAQAALSLTTVESYQEDLNQINQRYERGLRSPLDLRLAQSNLASAQAQLAFRRQALERAARQLELLLGRYPSALPTHEYALPALPETIPGGLPAELVKRRPDLIAAERRLMAADQAWVQAQRRLYPSFSLTLSGGTSSNQLKDLLDGDFGVWSLLGNLVEPLFQGGRLKAGVSFAEGSFQWSLAQYADAALKAYGEVENALAAEHWLALREVHLKQASEQAAAAQTLAESRYQQGLSPYLNVLESQRRALQSESERIAIQAGRLSNRVDLFLALGGGFDNPFTNPTQHANNQDSSSKEPSP